MTNEHSAASSTYGSGAVVTPEAVRLDFQAAGVGSRGVAQMLDLLLLGMALFIVNFAVALIVSTNGLGLPETAAVVVFFILNLVLFFGYPITFEVWRGRTLGKAAMGLRVVTVDGAPVRFRHAAIRAALLLIDLGFFFGLPALISMLSTRRHQRLGDLSAGTMVLRERLVAPSVAPAHFSVPAGLSGYAATVDASGLSVEDYNVLRSFLLRAHQLQPDVRDQLAQRLAETFAAKLGADAPEGLSVEQFLVTLAARYQQRGEGALAATGHGPYQAPGGGYRPPGAPPSQPPPPPGDPGPPPKLGDFVPPS